MEFSRQEYWSGLPCSPPGDLPNPGIETTPPASPALQADSLPWQLSYQGNPILLISIPNSPPALRSRDHHTGLLGSRPKDFISNARPEESCWRSDRESEGCRFSWKFSSGRILEGRKESNSYTDLDPRELLENKRRIRIIPPAVLPLSRDPPPSSEPLACLITQGQIEIITGMAACHRL